MDLKELTQYTPDCLCVAYLRDFQIVCYPSGHVLNSLSPSAGHSISMHDKTQPPHGFS